MWASWLCVLLAEMREGARPKETIERLTPSAWRLAASCMVAISAGSPLAGVTDRPDAVIRWLAIGAIALSTINMFGGFAVTQRMLEMFRK